MRKECTFDEPQGIFGRTHLGEVVLDLSSRHELVPILAGLQYLHGKPLILCRILKLIEQDVLGNKSGEHGAPGMTYWEILVLSAVRQGCDLDYDALTDLANNHRALRAIMGVDEWGKEKLKHRTVHGNVSKLRTETIEQISQIVVGQGHRLAPQAPEKVRGDEFVVETDIHYPTDSSLIVDGLRVSLRLVTQLADQTGQSGWRQHEHLHRRAKKLDRRIQNARKAKRGKEAQTSAGEGKAKAGKPQPRKAAVDKETQSQRDRYRELIEHARRIEKRILETVAAARVERESMDVMSGVVVEELIKELMDFVAKTAYVCQLAERRVLLGERIPNHEKRFSLFETHTELVNRGKSPNPIEFGRRVLVMEDAAGFIVYFHVLEHDELDKGLMVPVMKALQERLNDKIRAASFDKGLYSKKNLEDLKDLVSTACLPKRGKLSEAERAAESTVEFRRARQRHPGIESAIHALEAGNGLGRCRDRGEEGFKRYVALAVLGRNLHTLGRILLRQMRRKAKAG